jgi:putative sigma-54 modulation protein
MAVEEAALQLGSSADGFLVFRDAATLRVNVLFKRKDGNLGLIESEA